MKPKAYLPIIISLCFAALPAVAQLENLLNQSAASSEAPKPAADIRDQLGIWKTETGEELERLGRFASAGQLPEGVAAADLSAWKRVLGQTQLAITRHLLILDDVKESKLGLEASKTAAADWKGFDESPPYSVLMVDEFVNLKESLEEKQGSNRSSVDVFKTTLEGLLTESKAAEEATASALKAFDTGGRTDAAQWAVDISRARQRYLFIRASALQYDISRLEDVIRANGIDLGLITRKISEARKAMVFSDADLAKIKEASADRNSSNRKEIADIRKRQRKAVSDRDAAASVVAQLKDTQDAAALALAELNLEAAETQVEALQQISDSLESFGQIESFVPEAYELRLTLMGSKMPDERRAALDSLTALSQRLNAWEIVAKNELTSVAADINKVQSRAALIPAEDPGLAPLSRQRDILWEKQAVVQRAYQSISSQRIYLVRWVEEYGGKDKPPWYAPAAETLSRTWAATQRIWNIPVSKYEETIEVEGQTVVQVRFVSLGAIVTALVLFIIAYLITSRISRRLQRLFVERHFIGENQARTIRNWIMLLVALLLALATLSWLSIPLTIFAFLAGALAIGVGFGTQTIIKNFISGIILLFERKVRVGDIIEVDGTLGVVSEINTRSSIVRGFNGIENLIPNSLFLENRVVNWTLNSRFLRRELNLGVAYGSPTQEIIQILNEAAERHGLILKEPAPFSAFSNFGENALEFTLYFWIELNDKTNALVVESDLRIMIDKRLTEGGIGVPFPQRDMHLSTAKPLQVEIAERKAEPGTEVPPETKKPPLP